MSPDMRFTLLILLLISFTACPPPPQPGITQPAPTAPAPTEPPPTVTTAQGGATTASQKPKNIILMIGDGMGVSQITGGLYSNNDQLELERFRVMGLHKSYSSDNLVTDSAAGATAFSCGVKTYNGAIGVDADTVSVPTILELVEAEGFTTGLIATSSITHASPASFIAHNSYRRNYEAIAEDFLDTEIDLFIGGGFKYFSRREKDERDLILELQQNGYQVENFLGKELTEISPDTAQNFVYFTADAEPLPYSQGRDYLLPAVELAPAFLQQHSETDAGFFLMIEGSQIDWGGHANDHQYIVSEMLEFDRAIGKILDFAAADGETLVIVTADHETGGYAINYGSTRDSIVPAFTSDYHTADLIPVFAFGPGAEQFGGIYENTAIYDKMMDLLGLD